MIGRMDMGLQHEIGLMATHFGEEMNTTRLKTYVAALKPYDEGLVWQAIQCLMREAEWFPKVAQIVARVRRIQDENRARMALPEPAIEEWERDLNAAVAPHFIGFLERSLAAKDDDQRHDALQQWCEDFAGCARVLKVDHRINWRTWEGFGLTVPDFVSRAGG